MQNSLIPALMAAAVTAAAPAQPLSEQFLYQGELTDNGAPADGSYDFQFRLFTAATGGSIVGNPITRSNVSVDDGYVQTTVGFGGIGLIFDGDRRWLEVAVRNAGSGTYTTLGRTEITATPYSSFAINAENADFAQFSGTTLDEAYDNGTTIDADAGPVSIINSDTSPGTAFADLELGGTGSRQGRLTLNNFNAIRTLEAGSVNPGGYVQGYGATGDTVWQMAPDTSSFGGGSAVVYRRTGAGSGSGGTSFGIQLEGNWAGSEKSRLTLFDDPGGTNITLAMDQQGDNSVQFKPDAINAIEMLNEPGLASSTASVVTALSAASATIDNIRSASVVCPTAGFVLAIATGEVSVAHTAGQNSSAEFGVSDTPNTRSSTQDIEVRIPSSAATGRYDYPVTVHGVFPVNAGTRTFYFVGDRNTGGTVDVLDPTISLVFIPTNYGSVTGSRSGPNQLPDERAPHVLGGLSPEHVHRERVQSEQAHRNRIARDLAEMRERMAALETELAAELALNPVSNEEEH